jgi:hypothetical protein
MHLFVAQEAVELSYYTLKDHPTKVEMTWETSKEIDIKQFNIYRSVDLTNYYLVGEIPAKKIKNGAKYKYADPTAGGSISYYKIEAITLTDKKITLSNAKIDRFDKQKAIYVTANIENGTFHLTSAEQIFSMELELTDMLERVYRLSYVRDNTHELTVITGPIEKGPYYVTCFINGNRTTRVKIMFI